MVSHRWREMAARRWSVTPVRSHGRLMQHGRKCTFFFFSPHSMMDSISCDGRKSLPELTPHLQQVALTGPWVTPSPKFPQGHRRANRQLSPDCLATGDVAVAQLWMYHLRKCVYGRSVHTFEGWDRKTACSFSCTIIWRNGLKQQPLLHIKTYKLCFV